MHARRTTSALILAAVMLCTVAASPAPEASPPDADAIFAKARAAWGQGSYPRYATYATIVEFRNGPKLVRRTWDTVEDFRHATVFSHKFSREETANPPPAPTGINIAIPFLSHLNEVQPVDPVGHVAFAVDQDYGLAPAERHVVVATSAGDFSATSRKLPVIGRTGTRARDYDVKLVETLQGEGGTEYHLALNPLRDPQRYRLRELWIDGTTFLPRQAVVAGIGNRAPLTTVAWRIEFRQLQGATYVARETALDAVDYGAAGTLASLTVTFGEFAATPLPTGWKFALGMSDDRPNADP